MHGDDHRHVVPKRDVVRLVIEIDSVPAQPVGERDLLLNMTKPACDQEAW